MYDVWDSTEQFTNRLQKWGNIKKSNVFQLNRRPFGDVESCNGGINSFPHRSWDGGGLLMYRRFGWLEFGWMVWKVWTDGVAGNTHAAEPEMWIFLEGCRYTSENHRRGSTAGPGEGGTSRSRAGRLCFCCLSLPLSLLDAPPLHPSSLISDSLWYSPL